jgi:hypothetical protein
MDAIRRGPLSERDASLKLVVLNVTSCAIPDPFGAGSICVGLESSSQEESPSFRRPELKVRQWLVGAACAGYLLAASGHAFAAGPRIFLEGIDLPAMAGESFEVLVRGEGFGHTLVGQVIDNVSGGQKFALHFDASLFELETVSIDGRWGFAAARKLGSVDAVAGVLSGVGFGSFPAVVDDSFGIGTLRFRALKAGEGEIGITGGEIVGRVAGASGKLIPVSFEPLNVQIAAVPIPEPGTWALLVGGLGLLAWRTRQSGMTRVSS